MMLLLPGRRLRFEKRTCHYQEYLAPKKGEQNVSQWKFQSIVKSVEKVIMTGASFGAKKIYYSETGGHVLTPFFGTCQDRRWNGRGCRFGLLPFWKVLPISKCGRFKKESDLPKMENGR